jgi:2-dehydropantoate 2-reductase
VHAAHPLMTFGPRLENLGWYERIPFVIDDGEEFERLLPGLKNPNSTLAPALRPLYHALASLAGNSTYLLWREIGDEFERKLGLPRGLLAPFLHQVVENAAMPEAQGFTGPVARGDWQTVAQHLRALEPTKLAQSYHEFLNLAGRAGHPMPKELV